MSSNTKGFANEKFTNIKTTFDQILDSSKDSGAALAIWHEGELVVDLWGGIANQNNGKTWGEETAAVIFSCTKGLMSLAIAQLFERNLLSYDDLVVKYWPEYGSASKSKTTIRDLVSHRAGLPYFAENIELQEVLNWDLMVSKLEQEEPLWEPGNTYAYHAITHGWLAGEIIRRITGLMPGKYLEQEIASMVGATTWLGLAEELESKVAFSYSRTDLKDFFEDLIKQSTPEGNFLIRSLTLGSAFPVNLVGENVGFNSRAVHEAQIPGAGGISTARGLAKIWSATVCETDGVRLLSDETVKEVTAVQSEGKPFTDLKPPYSRFGMGFQLDSEARRYLTNASFGHDGAGGQCAFADPKHKIGFTFITTEMGGGVIEDDRATRLIEQLRLSLTN
jgi:CubicO group peptidase (beta-lactamase class C family)